MSLKEIKAPFLKRDGAFLIDGDRAGSISRLMLPAMGPLLTYSDPGYTDKFLDNNSLSG